MHLPIKVLIVEDDQHKLDAVRAYLGEVFGERAYIQSCGAISTASKCLSESSYDVVVIDMSIPSHPTAVGEGSPYSFPSGGLDVLFHVEELGHDSKCIILTQYPDIEMEGVLVPVEQARAQILESFQIEVAACIKYDEDDPIWRSQFRDCLENIL